MNQETCGQDAVEVSIVMPCLNEAETVVRCVEKSLRAFRENSICGEVIVADNGSTDGSRELARDAGARVVSVEAKGYGSALMGGILAARGKYVIMGDADDSYDFSHVPRFLEKLRAGHDLVMGNRFLGGIQPGAMPTLHRYLGNPVLSGVGRLFFHSPCGDFHCGLRGFSKDAIEKLDLRTTGMEFASEMVVKATLHGLRIGEVPTTLAPDGRSRPPHLRSWRDGWRHLRFLLLYSPRWLFFYPGLTLLISGLSIILWLLPGPRRVGSVVLDVHTMLGGAALILIGFQSVAFAVLAKVFAVNSGLMPWTPGFRRIFDWITLETGLIVGALLILGGALRNRRHVLDLESIRLWAARSAENAPLGHPRGNGNGARLSSRAFQLLLQHVRAGSKMTTPEFDALAGNYAQQLNRALAVTGESVDYYAEQRVLHLARRLEQRGIRAANILDFGCGTGTATPYFLRRLGVGSVLGVDVSTESLRTASSQFAGLPASFLELSHFEPRGNFELAFCNGVFHHIPPANRSDALRVVYTALRRGGLFAFWENNPWNPGTQWVMSHTPFDRDAIKISPIQADVLLRTAGFRVLATDALFIFPRALRWFRPLEKLLLRLPLGGQYVVLCVKDGD